MSKTGNGATLTTTNPAWTGRIRVIGGITQSYPILENNDLLTTGQSRVCIGDLKEVSPAEIQIFYDPDDPPPVGSIGHTFTITYPIYNGGSLGANIAGTGFLHESTTPELANNQLLEGSFMIQFDGETDLVENAEAP